MPPPPCPACHTRPRRPGQYLCGPCWGSLPAPTRRALTRRDGRAYARLRALHVALEAGTPLVDIRIT
ncbi:hypothetical protein [Wenjunlia vitaminophila]|uniref:hypothetical protein n=1 Tax=Wenjunlia vitaminophila TaxID=76728 RepID=UPI000A30EBF4|nr:hypothetical protein [Wenjunlia vitaminophila]